MTLRRLALFLAFALLIFAAADAPTGRVKELAPGVFFWQGDRDKRQPANCGWVIFKDYIFVIDANFPWGAREILPEIKKTSNKPIRFVFLTHYHGDHAYGAGLFVDAGAAVVCSEDCAGESRTKGQASWDKNTETGEFSLKPYRLEHPSVVFDEEMTFDDGEHRVELMKVGPAHSKGDAVAYLPKERILFSGDVCVNWKSGNNVADRDADHANWVRVLGKLARWDVKTLVPGHGALGTTNTLWAQQAFLSDVWEQVLAGAREGKTPEQLVQEINLSKHGNFAADPKQNANAIRAMYRKAAASR